MSLTVQYSRIDGVKKHFKKESQTDNIFVVNHFYGFGKTCFVGVNFFVRGVYSVSVGKSGFSFFYAFHLLEKMLRAPKASASKIYFFHHC